MIKTDYIWRINNLDVFYTNETNGGGDYFALEYIEVVKQWYASVDHVLEWCSGPGFIGYGMLATGAAKNVTLSEMYLPAIDIAQKTKEQNATYTNNINIVHGKNLENVTGKFDLVVANPPHWPSIDSAAKSLGFDPTQIDHIEDILVDTDWESHKQFFINVKPLLAKDGRILLQQNSNGSTANDFKQMTLDAGLAISFTAQSEMYADKGIYYIEVVHA